MDLLWSWIAVGWQCWSIQIVLVLLLLTRLFVSNSQLVNLQCQTIPVGMFEWNVVSIHQLNEV